MKIFIKKYIYIEILFILLLDFLLIYTLLYFGNDQQIYLRNIVFSQVVTDSDFSSEEDLNSFIAKGFKSEADSTIFRDYLSENTISKLLQIKLTSKNLDRDMAVGIVKYLGENPSGQICGVPSLGKVVFDVEKGIGCCSDYTKAWIFYASYFGLQVREVNTLAHNTVEYFDHARNKWAWLDPYNRIEILGLDRLPMSQFEIRNKTLFTFSSASRIEGSSSKFDAKNFSGYAPAQLSILMWRKGTNFLTVEGWDSYLRDLYIPKKIRQLILLTTGIAPNWIMFTTDAIGAYMRALQILIYLVGYIWVFLNMYLFGAIIYLFFFADCPVHSHRTAAD